MTLLLAPALAWSCGGSGRHNPGSAGASAGGSAAAAASSAAGTSPVSQGGSAAGGKAGGGGANADTAHGGEVRAAAGAPGAEAGASGSGAGAGGVGDDPLLGFECGTQRCSVSQACVRCSVNGSSGQLCVPHPTGDPAGYAAATETCDSPPSSIFNDCDGPEDCGSEQFCVAREGSGGFMRCHDMPSTEYSCCFACGALTDCTLCRTDADCRDNATCMPAEAAPAGVMGCHRPPN